MSGTCLFTVFYVSRLFEPAFSATLCFEACANARELEDFETEEFCLLTVRKALVKSLEVSDGVDANEDRKRAELGRKLPLEWDVGQMIRKNRILSNGPKHPKRVGG